MAASLPNFSSISSPFSPNSSRNCNHIPASFKLRYLKFSDSLKTELSSSPSPDLKVPVSRCSFEYKESVFRKERVTVPCHDEYFVKEGRHLLKLLPDAFMGIKQIGVTGYDSQVIAHARQLRDSLAAVESGIVVKIGLKRDSRYFGDARGAGFTEENGTLGNRHEAISCSDLVLFLDSDAVDADDYKEVFSHMKPNSILGLSHGFLPSHLQSMGLHFPKNISMIALYPRVTGQTYKKLWVQGEEFCGAKINSNFTVHKDIDGRATDVALGWSIALGSPFTFAVAERRYIENGERAEHAESNFQWRTGINFRTTSTEGMLALYSSLIMESDGEIATAYGGASYHPCIDNSYECSESSFRWYAKKEKTVKPAYRNVFYRITGIISKATLTMVILALCSLSGVGKATACSPSYYSCMDNFYAYTKDVAAGSVVPGHRFYEGLLLSSPMAKIPQTRFWEGYVNIQTPGKWIVGMGFGGKTPPVGGPGAQYRLVVCAFFAGACWTFALMMCLRWLNPSSDTTAENIMRGRGRPKKVVSKDQRSYRFNTNAEITTKKEVVSEDS